MTRLGVAAALLLAALAAQSSPRPRMDPVLVEIGNLCSWYSSCIRKQQRAMNRALYLIRSGRISPRLQTACSRTASRGVIRVNWVVFHSCIDGK